MKYNWQAVGHRLLEVRQIGNDGVERIVPEMVAELPEIGGLILPALLEPRHDEAEKLQVGVILFADVVIRFEDVLRSQSPPLCSFQGNHEEVGRTQGRIRDERDVGRAVEQNEVVEWSRFS